MSDLLSAEHVSALIVIAVATAVAVVAARRGTGGWLRWLAVLLLVDEVSWWIFVLAGGEPGTEIAYSLPLQLCDVAIFVAAAALWTRRPLLVEVTYFWGLAGTIQALLTPDLPQHFPSYPYFQYYIAHGGVVCAAVLLVFGVREHPRPGAVARITVLTAGFAALVGAVDAVTGANYMYLRAKPPTPTLVDLLGPWPVYILVAGLIGLLLFAILDAPFRLSGAAPRSAPTKQPH